ncbi:MAG: MOSC domain-containing protein [Bacteroidota bacterium]
MSKAAISHLFIYPVKSTFRISLTVSEVNNKGFKNDRIFAILNRQRQIITAREHPQLFAIKTRLDNDKLIFQTDADTAIEYPIAQQGTAQNAILFNSSIHVETIQHKVNNWLSDVLGESVQLVRMSEAQHRSIKPKYNGKAGDYIQFQDAAPIHLLSTSSLRALNEKLDQPVSIHHFRPNIVVEGSEAFAEDHWKQVIIGECAFDVAVKTARCTMTTIHPETQTIHHQQEPLRTLSTFRRTDKSVNFGIYLIPRQSGWVEVGDSVRVVL